ncbi:MAG TPA: 4Fe-4S ferredoxin [Dehalococcoidia bacterium]|nr:4Fe-4S ferredoxin [Dehalococcoidia bacterium]
MKLTRRNFLAWAGVAAVGAVACEGFGIREGEFDIQSPVSLPEDLVKGKDNWYATMCRICNSGEGIVVRVMEGRAKKVEGNPMFPINHGKHRPACEAALQALYHPDRIGTPMQRSGPRGSGHFSPISWSAALDKLQQELKVRGNSMLMVTDPLRGHLGTVVSRFTQSLGGRYMSFDALDNATYRGAIKGIFGQDLMPDFDLANTRFLLSFGADFLSTWVSPTRWNIGYGEFRSGEGKERGTFYHADSRFSMTAASADKWLPIEPGYEGHLAMSVAYVIISENLQAPGVDVGALTGGQGAEALEAFRPEAMAERVFLSGSMRGDEGVEAIRHLARQFAGKTPSLAIGGGSAGAQTNGLFNLKAIYALNYLVGSVAAEGGIRFNPGSPLDNAPASAPTGTLNDWIRVKQDLDSGAINMMLLRQANPVYGLPDQLRFREAIDTASNLFVASFSPFMDETTAMADLILPDRTSLEEWGDDIPEPGPGYQVVGFQQPVVNPFHELDPKSFPDLLLTMAQELGKEEDLPWPNYRSMLREGSDALFALNRGSIQAATADDFWNQLLQKGGWWDENAFGPQNVDAPNGLFSDLARDAAAPKFSGAASSDTTFYLVPFAHNSLQDGQYAHLPWLQATPDPLTTITWQTWAEINDVDARFLGIKEGDVLEIRSSQGAIKVLAYPSPAAPHGTIAVPLGQGHTHGTEWATDRPATESANVLDILEPAQVEGTGSLAWANTWVNVSKTDDSVKVAKFEGIVRAVEIGILPSERIIQTITPEDA